MSEIQCLNILYLQFFLIIVLRIEYVLELIDYQHNFHNKTCLVTNSTDSFYAKFISVKFYLMFLSHYLFHFCKNFNNKNWFLPKFMMFVKIIENLKINQSIKCSTVTLTNSFE